MKDHQCIVADCERQICCHRCPRERVCKRACHNTADKCGMYCPLPPVYDRGLWIKNVRSVSNAQHGSAHGAAGS